MLVEISDHHACSGTLECEAGLLRQMHANSLVTAASKSGQAHDPPKTSHLCVDRRIRISKASYEKDVVTAEQPTESTLCSEPTTPKGAAKQDSRSAHK
jgi:hypothetical protein